MSSTTDPNTVVARFEDRRHAAHYLSTLRRAGFHRHEIQVIWPHREVFAHQAVAGLRLGALAGLVLGIFAGAYLTGRFPHDNPTLHVHFFLGVLFAALVTAVGGAIIGGLIAIMVPAAETGLLAADARPGPTIVLVHSSDPARLEQARAAREAAHGDSA